MRVSGQDHKKEKDFLSNILSQQSSLVAGESCSITKFGAIHRKSNISRSLLLEKVKHISDERKILEV